MEKNKPLSQKNHLMPSMFLLFSSTIVGLFLIEFLFRFYVFGKNSFSIEKINSTHHLGVSGLVTPARNSELIYELKPNLRTTFKLTPFNTNSKGLRDKEYAFSKAEDTFRVAVIGDSLTMGAGVNIKETFHSLLENRFTKERPDNIYEFINFGVGGYSLRQYLGVLNSKVKSYNPDVVLVGFYPGNDHQILPEKNYKVAYQVKQINYPFYSSFVYHAYSRLLTKLDYITNQPTEEEIEYVSEIFKKLSIYSQNNNIPIVIVYLTARTDHAVRPELILQISKMHGLDFIDASRNFSHQVSGKYNIYLTDFHPNAEANKIFSKQIYEHLTNSSLLIKR